MKVHALSHGIYIFKEIQHKISIYPICHPGMLRTSMSINIKPVTAVFSEKNLQFGILSMFIQEFLIFMTLGETSRWDSPVGLGNNI